MAIVGTKVKIVREENINLAVKTEQVLDTKTGLLLERKTVVAAVPTESGETAVISAQKTSLAAVQVRFERFLHLLFTVKIKCFFLHSHTTQYNRQDPPSMAEKWHSSQ